MQQDFPQHRAMALERISEVRGYRQIQFFASISPPEARLEFVSWVSGALEDAHISHLGPKLRRGCRQRELIFVKSGSVDYKFESNDLVYHTWQAGDVFGLEDFIYRLPIKQRSLLVDGQMNFCQYEITTWGKRKFTPDWDKFSSSEVFSLDMHKHMKEWQRRFSD